MRDEQEIYNLVLNIANRDKRIEAVLLNGSRANPNVPKDDFQDYDIVFVTNFIEDIISDTYYHKKIGDILIMQKPNEFRNKMEYNCFAYLMQFQDLTRIDLRLIKPEFLEDYLDDAFSKVLLDKKNKYLDYNFERSALYETKQLSEDEINKILNEIYWVSTYVVKGIARNDIIYSEFMISNPIKNAFIKLLKQKILIEKELDSLSFGKLDKDILQYITDKDQLLKIFSNKSLKDIESNLRFLLDETNQMAKYISINRKLNLNQGEYQSAMKFMNIFLSNSYQNFN
ncbi:TPA: aminoglycoside 6-adenylyltransferase [Streptococcus agalactiae]|nr:aminoglycoside 6-adenylyltransferase [Streptococcus agalactiae]